MILLITGRGISVSFVTISFLIAKPPFFLLQVYHSGRKSR
ncbi:hypothetical protein NP493_798g01029 [Ridgeia piscesae]|uniref:Uncharacterized protein n=1 Tax=Ridgeia piscesae TaxID=27915 RepID=A0AAD9KPZ4_RIDPI|nr:hypothetical protein NP493_798g01029 [Ridgeia piscesae]